MSWCSDAEPIRSLEFKISTAHVMPEADRGNGGNIASGRCVETADILHSKLFARDKCWTTLFFRKTPRHCSAIVAICLTLLGLSLCMLQQDCISGLRALLHNCLRKWAAISHRSHDLAQFAKSFCCSNYLIRDPLNQSFCRVCLCQTDLGKWSEHSRMFLLVCS